MRLMVLILMALSVGFANSDLNGVWVGGLNTCDVDSSPACNRVILNVTRDGNRLRVIEVARGKVGSSIAERDYFFKGAVRPSGAEMGTATTDGRMTILRSSDHIERWSISADGSVLTVNRWLGVSPKDPQRVLCFRRSKTAAE
jgi:hypothetical protein